MTIRIRAFAVYRELLGRDVIDLELPATMSPVTPRAVFEHLFHDRSDLARLLRATMFAVNKEYVGGDAVLSSGDELALIPPVAGGIETQAAFG
jgi:molybdopterin converting factor small subunit